MSWKWSALTLDTVRSVISCSKARVSSACFWLCSAIFSLNFLGLEPPVLGEPDIVRAALLQLQSATWKKWKTVLGVYFSESLSERCGAPISVLNTSLLIQVFRVNSAGGRGWSELTTSVAKLPIKRSLIKVILLCQGGSLIKVYTNDLCL